MWVTQFDLTLEFDGSLLVIYPQIKKTYNVHTTNCMLNICTEKEPPQKGKENTSGIFSLAFTTYSVFPKLSTFQNWEHKEDADQ